MFPKIKSERSVALSLLLLAACGSSGGGGEELPLYPNSGNTQPSTTPDSGFSTSRPLDVPELTAPDGGGDGSIDDGGANDSSTGDGGLADGAVSDSGGGNCAVIVSDKDCDKSKRPVVFIHGTMGAADNGEHLALLFGSNGYCQTRFAGVDYNSMGDNPYTQLDALIDKLLKETGADKVELMGHSQGGRWGYDYIASTAARAAKIANYVHLAGGNRDVPPNKVRTMSISSKSDQIGVNQITGAEKIVIFEKHDHMGVAMSSESFVEIWKFFYNADPKYKTVQCGDDEIVIQGKVETFGDNVPAAGHKMTIHEVGTQPRQAGTEVFAGVLPADGSFGPLKAKRGVYYESVVAKPDGSVVGHMYFTPWLRSDLMVRGLIPSQHPVTGTVTAALPLSEEHSVLAVRYNQSALRKDLGHSLTIDGIEVLTTEQAQASTTTVGLFLVDDNNNKKSDLGALPVFSVLPFVKGSDVYMQAKTPAFINVKFNGVALKVPNWPSKSNGPTVVMFQ